MFLVAVMASVAVAAAAAVRCPGGVYSGALEECPTDLGHMGEGLPSTCCFGFAMMLGLNSRPCIRLGKRSAPWSYIPSPSGYLLYPYLIDLVLVACCSHPIHAEGVGLKSLVGVCPVQLFSHLHVSGHTQASLGPSSSLYMKIVPTQPSHLHIFT